MRAIVIHAPGGPEVMKVEEVPDPTPAPGEVRVRTAGAGVNRADLMQREGRYPAPPGASPVLGLELSGILLDDAPGLPAGSRVMALVGGGGCSTMASVPAGQLMAVPAGLSPEEAAAVPEAFLTAYHNLFDIGGLVAGQSVLIHAAGSGVGTAAIQLARAAGARVLVTARTAEKLDRCRELGAEVTLAVSGEGFADEVIRETDGAGVNLILDFVGAPYWSDNVNCLARGGRMALIGTLGGGRAEIEIGLLMYKRLRVEGSTLRGQSPAEKAALVQRGAAVIVEGLANGTLRPVLDRVFPLEQAADAHRYMESGGNFGKIVLSTGTGW
ncbi:MAG: NAD(P)H-quinone oxidoreductase [Chloroflexi bacterium]|nr:NAD(P)H-quinone oxidoreductase [Chloroflexota bacterium]